MDKHNNYLRQMTATTDNTLSLSTVLLLLGLYVCVCACNAQIQALQIASKRLQQILQQWHMDN